MNKRGFSLIEVILAVALFAMFVTAFVGVYLYGEESSALAGARGRATLLAQEGLEAVRNIRDEDFANLTDGTYGLGVSGGQWVLTGSSDVVGVFTREITIASIDADRKSVTSTVSWQQNAQRTGLIAIASRLTQWMRVVSVAGDWASPSQSGAINLSGNSNASKVQIDGSYAYVLRSSSPNFLVIDISDTASPTEVGSTTLSGTLSNLFVTGGYAYVTSNDNSAELQIVDISAPSSPSLTGTYNDSGNDDARGVYVSGNYAYLALNGGNDFVVVDVSNPASPSFADGLSLNGGAYEVAVDGNYAFIASDSNNRELQVVNISNPLSVSLADSLNLSSNTNATTIAVASGYAYVGQRTSFVIVNVSTPTAVSLAGTYSAGGTVNDIALALAATNTQVFIATTSNTAEFQVIDVTNPLVPALLSSIDTAGTSNLTGMAYDAASDVAVGVGDDNTEEVIVFIPG